MPFFLGVDGGQSSTTALLADETGRVAGSGVSGPCNHITGPEAHARFTRVITSCIQQACDAAGLDSALITFESVCCGMSGGVSDKAELLRQILRAHHISVVDDGVIALSGAVGIGPGVVVIAGTGSIAYARDHSGKLTRAGGWGFVFGDEGSAFDIVRQALRASLRFEEGWGPPTTLHQMLLGATGAPSLNHAMHLFYTADWPRSRIAALAPQVDAAAEAGDALARGILEQAAHSLASLAAAVRSNIPDSGAVPVSPAGGVFRSAILLRRFQSLVELTDGCRFQLPLLGPAAGALLQAFNAAHQTVTLSNIPNLK